MTTGRAAIGGSLEDMADLTTQLVEQLDWHWSGQLRPRLDGLTDDEYFWQPVPDCWTVHPDGTIDFAYPAPDPAPIAAGASAGPRTARSSPPKSAAYQHLTALRRPAEGV
ncbi:hypothetical protein Mkiyose1088_15280 [Mycobacterium kiyosense]|nr:hypothetical protein Mkiyose1088_15280 [Mycobacterium kiyosense]